MTCMSLSMLSEQSLPNETAQAIYHKLDLRLCPAALGIRSVTNCSREMSICIPEGTK